MLSIDRNWLQFCVWARSDAQSFFFGALGAYLFYTRVREKKPLGAAAGGLLVGMSILTQVNGLIFGAICLLLGIRELWRDYRNVSVYAGGFGLFVVAALYAWFIRLYPDYYHGQMGWVASVLDRLDGWS